MKAKRINCNKPKFDGSFSGKEISLIDRAIEKAVKSRKLVDAKDYFKGYY